MQDKKVQPYTPVCTPAELKKMLEPNHRNDKFDRIESQYDHRTQLREYINLKEKTKQDRMEKKNRPYSMYTNEYESNIKEYRIKDRVAYNKYRNR